MFSEKQGYRGLLFKQHYNLIGPALNLALQGKNVEF